MAAGSSPRTSRVSDQIVEAFNALQDDEAENEWCYSCGGDGWYVGHDDECYDTGVCNCSRVQICCDSCGGTGKAKR